MNNQPYYNTKNWLYLPFTEVAGHTRRHPTESRNDLETAADDPWTNVPPDPPLERHGGHAKEDPDELPGKTEGSGDHECHGGAERHGIRRTLPGVQLLEEQILQEGWSGLFGRQPPPGVQHLSEPVQKDLRWRTEAPRSKHEQTGVPSRWTNWLCYVKRIWSFIMDWTLK